MRCEEWIASFSQSPIYNTNPVAGMATGRRRLGTNPFFPNRKEILYTVMGRSAFEELCEIRLEIHDQQFMTHHSILSINARILENTHLTHK